MSLYPIRMLIGGIALLALSQAAPLRAAPALPDVVSRPARNFAHPEQMVILGVARAGDRLVAVGERGIVLLSDDDGLHWRQAAVPTSVSLTRVQFVSDRVGWAVGHMGTVIKTADGGATWKIQLDGLRAAKLALQNLEQRRANWVGDSAELDAKIASAQLLVEDGPDKPFLSLMFESEKKGVIVGAYNLAFMTEDGGNTWVSQQGDVTNPSGFHLYDICRSGDRLFMVGEQGLLLEATIEEGIFRPLASPYEGSFFGILAGKDGGLLAFGLRGNVFRSGDRGQTWAQVPLQIPASVNAGLVRADGSYLLLTQAGQVLRSRDGVSAFKPVPGIPSALYTSAVESRKGTLILGGLRGVVRVSKDK